MNNKTVTEFGFRIIGRIMEISEGVIRRGRNTLLDLHKDTQPHSLTVNYCLNYNGIPEFMRKPPMLTV